MAVNSAQTAALSRIRHLHSHRKWVVAPAPEAALRRLLRHNAATAYAAVGSLAPYREDLVSLPDGTERPCFLRDILPDVWGKVLDSFEDSMLLPQSERDAIAEDSSVAEQFYFDPVLSEDAPAYARYLARLHAAGVVDFCARGRVTIGLFFVTKKNGKLRFIADARRSNALFRRPPRTVLGSMESWGRITLSGRDRKTLSSSTLFVAQEDVRDYFFRLRMPEGLKDFFCLPHVSVALLVDAFINLGFDVPESVRELGHVYKDIAPRFAVLPMVFLGLFILHMLLTNI